MIGSAAAEVFEPARLGPVELRNRVIKAVSAADLHRITRAHAEARSLCIHCNKCMPTIYSGTRCVLATSDGGVTARRQA